MPKMAASKALSWRRNMKRLFIASKSGVAAKLSGESWRLIGREDSENLAAAYYGS